MTDVPGPGAGHLPAEAAAGLALLAALGIRGFFVPAFFLELTEHALLGQLALKKLDGFFNVVVLNRNLQLKSPRFPAGISPVSGGRSFGLISPGRVVTALRDAGAVFGLATGGGRVIIAKRRYSRTAMRPPSISWGSTLVKGHEVFLHMSLFGRNRGLVLALGGGGARGFAHVGVLEVLAERGVKVAGLAGSSAGALAGAGFALGNSPAAMRKRVLQFAKSRLAKDERVKALVENDRQDACEGWGGRLDRFFHKSKMLRSFLLSESVLDPDYMSHLVEFFLPQARLEHTVIPFAAVATDFKSGQAVLLREGSLRKAVTASCSVPGVTPLVEIGGRHYMDGGVACLVPAKIAGELFPGYPVLAVGLRRDPACEVLPSSALEIYFRSSEVQNIILAETQLAQADLSLTPEVEKVHWADFSQAGFIMDQGRKAALEAWPQIERLARGHGWLRTWSRRHSGA